MRTLSFLISILYIALFAFIEVGHAECAIEKGPPQGMMEYMARVRTELSRIRSQAGSVNQCNGQQGSFSSERRALETLKRVDEVFSGWGTMVTNFTYNVPATAEGGSRGPVTNHGKLWRDLEAEATRTLQSVASICALDQTISSGGTPNGRIARIIENNRKIEAYYWQVVLGNGYNDQPEDMTNYSGVLNAIRDNYNYEVTRTCKGPELIDDVETAIKNLMSSAGKFGKGNEKATQNWKDAIAIFSGNNASKEKYIDVERRVLNAELTRQGLSTNSKKAILGKQGCFNTRITETSSAEERSKAWIGCISGLVSGLDNVSRPLQLFIPKSRTTTEYLANTLKYDAEKYRISTDMGSIWSTLESELKVNDEATNQKVLNDLVGTHLKIVTINSPLKKAIEEMYKNCMTGQPDISCPRP